MRTRHDDFLQTAIFPTRREMGEAAATAAARALKQAIKARGEARLILASAPSQAELLEALTVAPLEWGRVTLFHMDEYVGLGPEHPASFRRFQERYVLNRVAPRAFHGLRGEAADLDAECGRYAALLAEAPIDVICLGIGENGHLAFNDPPVADFDDPVLVKRVELDEACRAQQVNDGCFPEMSAVPREALTLTIPALLGGRQLFGVVPGPRKAAAVLKALTGPISTNCPASVLRRHLAARLFLDEDSAGLLRR